MPKLNSWKQALALITFMFLSFLGVKVSANTTLNQEAAQEQKNLSNSLLDNQKTLLAQGCPSDSDHNSPRPYAQVFTKSGTLSIRSAPNGRIIGAIPSGWQVVTVKKDTTGRWTYITGSGNERYGFANAPDFRRDGWVSTAYLRRLGRFCNKPNSLRSNELNTLSAEKKILVNEDWVLRGDRIAEFISKR